MNGIRKAFFAKPLAVYLAAALIAASAFAGPAEAMYLSPGSGPAPDFQSPAQHPGPFVQGGQA